MKKKWICFMLALLMLIAVAPVAMADPEITEDSIVTIIKVKKYANVHATADRDSKVLGWAPVGNTYKLLAAEGDYYMIQYKTSTVGYVSKSFCKVGKKGDIPSGSKIATITKVPSNGNGVNIRDAANSKTGNVLGVAHLGDKFEVTGKSGKWTKVIYKGATAYIYTYYLSISGGSSDTEITPVADETAYINCKIKVRVRAKASSGSKKLGYLKKGTEITVTGTSKKWIRIKYAAGEGGEAFVSSSYVSYIKPGEDVNGKTATIINCKEFVNVREKASSSSSSKIIGTAKPGETYTAKGISGKWVKVDFGGKTGYIYKTYVKIS